MGFDESFLGVDAPLPRIEDPETVQLDYVHFTVLHDPERRFARVTAVNIDGGSLLDLPRDDDWEFDDRIPESQQAGPQIYARNDLDRGHLVRRRDPVWGDIETARQANADTFRFTNAAPQQAEFNQSLELWNGLEDHVLEFAQAFAQRLSVFTAPILADDDPPYRGVRVPLRFWKIAAWRRDGELATTGFLLDQSPVIDLSRDPAAVAARAAREAQRIAADEIPDLGPFRTFQVAVSDIAELTGLDMPELVAADRRPRGIAPGRWRQVESREDLLIG